MILVSRHAGYEFAGCECEAATDNAVAEILDAFD